MLVNKCILYFPKDCPVVDPALNSAIYHLMRKEKRLVTEMENSSFPHK